MIDEVYCVNIRKRPDRLEKFKEQRGVEIEDKLGLKIKYTTNWTNNLDGEDITDEWLNENGMNVYDKWEMKEEQWYQGARWGWWNRQLSRGEIGCTISHSEIWKVAKGNVLVLEDDVIFKRNWILKIYNTIDTLKAMDKTWDLIYLGRVPQYDSETGGDGKGKYIGDIKPEDCYITSKIKKPLYSFCTYGYILSQTGIEKLKEYNVQKDIIPADEFLTATYNPHPREDIRLKYPPTLLAYAIEPNMVYQANWGADTENKGEKPKW